LQTKAAKPSKKPYTQGLCPFVKGATASSFRLHAWTWCRHVISCSL